MNKIKKVLSILLIILIFFQFIQFPEILKNEVYGVSRIIDFSNTTDIDLFDISAYSGWGIDYDKNDYSVYIDYGELKFISQINDLFPIASLKLKNTGKVEFKLKTLHGDREATWGESFNIDFDDGSTMRFHPNMGARAGYEYYKDFGIGRETGDYWSKRRDSEGDWDYTYLKFIIKGITGNIVDLGNVLYAGDYVNYSIETKGGNLIMKSASGLTFTEPIGNRKMTRIWFDPIRQWYSRHATGYIDDIIITPIVSISNIDITGQSNVEKGQTIGLNTIILPISNDIDKNLLWESSDLSIATVESIEGMAIVRGIKKGSVTITATAQDGSGVKGTKVITVTSNPAQGEAKYITIDDLIKYETGYSDPENDLKYKEEYKYDHNPNLLNGVAIDNTMGYADYNGKWQDIHYAQFSKVGTYTIQYRAQDNPSTAVNNNNFANYRYFSDAAESTIYVHRKPIALYTINGSAVTDNSYDLDHSVSHPSKGIALWEWQYINGNGILNKYIAASKLEGENVINSWLNAYGNVQYKLVLRVQDIEGAWSDPCIKAAGEISKPVADFSIEKNPMIYKMDTQKITDMSYDTNGLQISYNWTVIKNGQTILNNTDKDISSSLNQAINNLYPYVTGIYDVSLKVKNSAGVESNIITKDFEVIVCNVSPTVNFELVSNENPVWIFPKTLGLYTLKYRPSNTLFHEEYARFDTNVNDPNTDNTGFLYNWKLERFAVKDINNISGAPTNTYNYTTQFPFANSFKNQGLGWGAYRITLDVTDKPPMPPYQSSDAKSATVTKNYYIVPEISLVGSFESDKSEIMVGDSIKLKARSDKMVDTVGCNFNGTGYALSKVSEDSNYAYWEKNITISESITESGTYQLQFVGKTTYGGNGNVTREVKDTVPIDIVSLKLINFRITDIVNHPYITFPYTKDMLISNLIPYKAGYYVTFQIDSKGKPDDVYGRIDVGNNGRTDKVINMTKVVTGDTETWQGRFYTSPYLTLGTVISVKLDCTKGAVTYDYNIKESWDGRSLIVNGSALQDGRVNLTN